MRHDPAQDLIKIFERKRGEGCGACSICTGCLRDSDGDHDRYGMRFQERLWQGVRRLRKPGYMPQALQDTG